VLKEPVDRAGSTLGHAKETSESVSAWPRRLWLSCRVIVRIDRQAHPSYK